MEKRIQLTIISIGLISAVVVIVAFILVFVFLGYKGFESIARKMGIGKPDIIRGIEAGNLDIVKNSLQKDPGWIKRRYYGETLLYLSAQENKPEIVEFLIRKGADVNETNRNSKFPIQAAINRGSLDLVKTFVAAGANLKSEDMSPLRLATIHGNYEISKFLVESGADINELYSDPFDSLFTQQTPLDYAYASKNKLLIEYLLEHGANSATELNKKKK